jgi:hypothetical protein
MRIPSGYRAVRCFAVAAVVSTFTTPLQAQDVGSPLDDRVRLDELLGIAAVEARGQLNSLRWESILPSTHVVYNSRLPFSLNDRELWSGRGMNVAVAGGVSAAHPIRGGSIQTQLAPVLTYSQNRAFQIYPWPTPERSPFASPFFPANASADLPMRFGGLPLTTIHPGESHLTIEQGPVAYGISSESQWWGPGIRNALVLSNNAPGVPRVFVRTRRPVTTGIGTVEALLMAGTLTESMYFDTTTSNDYRSLSGLLVVFRPAWEPSLSIGLARAVVQPTSGPLGSVGHMLSALGNWESPRGDLEGDPAESATPAADQITSLFARWAIPGSGFEAYGEWARTEVPRDLGEFLTAPYHSQGYTLGFQLAQPVRRVGDHLRINGELTYLEQNRVFPERPPRDFYTGRATEQGFTHRGQVLGAAIGPGSSSQWVAVDYFAPRRSVGVYVSRIRWYTDAFYRQIDPRPARRDVTFLVGLRGSTPMHRMLVDGELTVNRRFNYLFQNEGYLGDSVDPIDITNFTFGLRMRPR